MNIISRLDDELRNQNFLETDSSQEFMDKYRRIAEGYSITENSIAVLSDMSSNRSWIYYSDFAECLGIDANEENIDSIWEKHILDRIHPEDLASKHLHELSLFHFMKKQGKHTHYYLAHKLRMKNNKGDYIPVLHRLFYAHSSSGKNLRLALCLYNPLSLQLPNDCLIINTKNGESFPLEQFSNSRILSRREIEVLQLIDKGFRSNEIAERLFISKNTVSRHRQEILAKLQVKNSIEACRIAKALGIL